MAVLQPLSSHWLVVFLLMATVDVSIFASSFVGSTAAADPTVAVEQCKFDQWENDDGLVPACVTFEQMKSYDMAISCYRRAANEKGSALAMAFLGRVYATGRGVPVDYKEAVKWFRKSAENGSAQGMFGLARMYAQGKGVSHDPGQVVKWLGLSAEQGYPQAQYELGLLYRDGRGVPKDLRKAASWFIKAADQGQEDAKKELKER